NVETVVLALYGFNSTTKKLVETLTAALKGFNDPYSTLSIGLTQDVITALEDVGRSNSVNNQMNLVGALRKAEVTITLAGLEDTNMGTKSKTRDIHAAQIKAFHEGFINALCVGLFGSSTVEP